MKEKLSEADYYKTLPKKRMASSGVFVNDKGQILIVKPTYRDNWLLPGGVVEENESPLVALHREIKEELDLVVDNPRFIGVAYKEKKEYKGEILIFFFYVGKLSDEDLEKIVFPDGEISEAKFVNSIQAKEKLVPSLAKNVDDIFKAIGGTGDCFYKDLLI
jgi:8-oxo-dGTP diphosphatase